jgi:hypothetical protein
MLGLKAVAVAGVLALMASGAHATTCDILNFTTSTDCVPTVGGGGGGNVTAAQMNIQAIFGETTWSQLAELEKPNLQSNPFVFSVEYGPDGAQSGTWSLNPLLTWGTGLYAFAIKGATDNAVYLMDTAFTSGTWNVLDLENNGENNPDMSNIRLFGTTALAPIPVPAAGFLLIGALGGLAALRRRKTA